MTEENSSTDLQGPAGLQEIGAGAATADVRESDAAQAVVPSAGVGEVAADPEIVIDDATMRRALEAILMVTDEPLPVLTLARTVGRPTGDVSAALTALSDEYAEQGRGFDLREVAGGWRYYTCEEAALYVERFVLDGQQARLTQAALETLAVVAYKQPVSRARVSAVRGVNVDGVMRTLISRGLVEDAGADTESQATLYRTTSYFLERMGMQSLDDLPELAPYLPEMDDMEEELTAQDVAAATPEAAADEPSEAADDHEPGDDGKPGDDLDPGENPGAVEVDLAVEVDPSGRSGAEPDPEGAGLDGAGLEGAGPEERPGTLSSYEVGPASREATGAEPSGQSGSETGPEGLDAGVRSSSTVGGGGSPDAGTSGGSWSNRDDD